MPELTEGLQDVAVGDLHPHRLHRAPAGELDRDLVESVRTLGILSPLLVRTDGTILAGKRRWEAAKALGLAAVPCRVVTLADDALFRFFNSAPVSGVETKPVEYARKLKSLMVGRRLKVRELAEAMHKPEDWVRDRLALADLAPEVAAVVDADDSPVALKVAFKIAKLPEEDQVAGLQVALALAANDAEKKRRA